MNAEKVPVGGGTAVTICQTDNPLGMSWSAEGLVFSDGQSIKRVSADGGSPEIIARAVGDYSAAFPQTLPDGRGRCLRSLRHCPGKTETRPSRKSWCRDR